MKKYAWLTILLVMSLLLGSIGFAHASIIPPRGEGQIGIGAIVVCEETAMYETDDTSSKVVLTLGFGDHIIVVEQAGEWARCVRSDSEDAPHGWVSAENLMIDPAFYMTEGKTPVYAWNDTAAPKEAWLDEYTLLSVLKIDGDWIVVPLNGATGWINVANEIQEGERFESVIMLEGMEETVQYERIRNDSIGIEIAYDYENFVRYSEADRECFVSRYDDPNAYENYLEVTYSVEDTEAAAASVGEALSKDYDITVDPVTLDGAGDCLKIDASVIKGTNMTGDRFQTVYIIPTADGSIIAAAHYTFESADGFGVRFRNMMNTLTVVGDGH